MNSLLLSNLPSEIDLSLRGTVYATFNQSALSSETGGYYDPRYEIYGLTDANINSGYIWSAKDSSSAIFKGWYTSQENYSSSEWPHINDATKLITTSKTISFEQVDSASTLFGGRNVIFAVYDEIFTITYDGNGGTPSKSSDIITTIGSSITTATATRAGYVFLGWFSDPIGGSRIADGGATYIPTSSITLYAHWAKELIVTYNPNGGTVTKYFDRVRVGGTFPELPTAIWDNETTNRWYTAQTGGTEIRQGDTVTQTEDFSLYAHWNRTETCTITFFAGGGTTSQTQRTVNKGEVIGTLPTATWTGHTFEGWFLSSGGGTAITADYIVDNDLYLYAQWDGDEYDVIFNGNGGTPSFSSKKVIYDNQYGTLPTCNQDGKTFLGWFTSASGGTKIEATTIFQLQSDQTLYAHWSDVNPAVKWYYLVSP